MRIQLVLDIEISHVSGKFASRQDAIDALISEMEGAGPGYIDINDSEYEVTDFGVCEFYEEPKPSKSKITDEHRNEILRQLGFEPVQDVLDKLTIREAGN